MEENQGLIRWVKEHKKELMVAGFSIVALILAVLVVRNQETIKDMWDTLRKATRNPTMTHTEAVAAVAKEIPSEPLHEEITTVSSDIDSVAFKVSRHIRNLPEGRHASQRKIAEAMENNIFLMDGQTWVEGYTKGQYNMAKYRIIFDGEELDEVFDSYDGALDYALYMVSCYHEGGEILELSNPGDYPYDPDDEPDFEIVGM